MSWFAEFFGALFEALRALYEFGDPQGAGQGWWGFVILLMWVVGLIVVPLAIARRTHAQGRSWVTVTMTCIAGFAGLWWIFGIIPSAWIFYVDAHQDILQDAIIPTAFTPFGLPIAEDLYNVIRDTVVVVWHLVFLGAVIWAAFRIQARYPRDLAPGEERPVSTGGYR
jgi:hypothetical protein